MVGSGLVLWTVKRRVKLPDPDRPYFGFRLVERLNIATIAGLPLAMTAFLWGNRLLPADAGQGSSGDATLAEGTVHGLDRLVAAIGGRVNYFAGFPKGSTAVMEPNIVHYRELQVTGGSNARRADVRRAVELLSSGALDVGSLVTHRFPLAEIDAAIAAVRQRAGLKVAVVPS